jgi:hypothetical protein
MTLRQGQIPYRKNAPGNASKSAAEAALGNASNAPALLQNARPIAF